MNGKDRIASVWPKWKVESVIGRGSFGTVYKAVNKSKGEESYSAIKVISIPQNEAELEELSCEGMTVDQSRTYYREMVGDLVNEIKLMESLKGTLNAVNIKDYYVEEKKGSFGWNIFIRMELLTPLNTYLCDRKLSEHDVIRLGMDICRVLMECAKKNVIHRDIKPENIFVDEFGNFKLGDFGIARKLENLTFGLSQKGTFNYMAPEMLTSSYYGANVDTYSLGVVLYKLMNGNRLPFLDASKQLLSPTERKMAVESRMKGDSMPAPRDASPEFAQIILKAAAHEPEERFQSATEMYDVLKELWNNETDDNEKADYGQIQNSGAEDNQALINSAESNAINWKKLILPICLIMAGGVMVFYAFGKWVKSGNDVIIGTSITAPVFEPTVSTAKTYDEQFNEVLELYNKGDYYKAAERFILLASDPEWKNTLTKGYTERTKEHRVVDKTNYYITRHDVYFYKEYEVMYDYTDDGIWVCGKLFKPSVNGEETFNFLMGSNGRPLVRYNSDSKRYEYFDDYAAYEIEEGSVFVNTGLEEQDAKFLKATELVKERRYNEAGALLIELAKDAEWLRAEFDYYQVVPDEETMEFGDVTYITQYLEEYWQGPYYGFFLSYSEDGELVYISVSMFDFENAEALGFIRISADGTFVFGDY